MNKTVLMLGMVIAGVLLARLVMARGFNMMKGMDEKKTYTSTDKVESVNIQEITGEIVVEKGNVDHVTVTYMDRKGESVYKISESEETLSIVRRKSLHLLDFDLVRHIMTVTIPDDLQGELKISNKSGSITLSNLAAKKIAIDNTSGSILLDQVDSESDITVKNITGPIILSDVQTDRDVEVNNTTGKIQLEKLKSEGNISLNIITGSVSGTVSGKESDYSISSKTVTGSSNLRNSDSGDKKLKVSTTTGNIKLLFTE